MKPSQRYRAMAHNRGRTGPERALATGLWRRGIRYFTHQGYKSATGERLSGDPDMVFPRKKIVIFVDGCFWHGCPQCRKHEGLRGQFWVDKINANRKRDLRVTRELTDAGWTVLRIPEHDVRTKSALAETIDHLVPTIHAASSGKLLPVQETMVSSQPVRDFILQNRPTDAPHRTAVSLFSGGGLSDLGYEMAGFRFVVQVESDQRRTAIGAKNFPTSQWLTCDVRDSANEIAASYRQKTSTRLDLLVATPPCQGMSSSNPSRGKRQTPQAKALEEKNRLLLEVIPVAHQLKPRVIVIENVRQVLTLEVECNGEKVTAVDLLRGGLPEYEVFPSIVNVADYGVPQVRKRALVVAIHRDEACLDEILSRKRLPVPRPTHAEQSPNGRQPWTSIQKWLETMGYESLDAGSKETAHGTHPLHFVPAYGPDRYRQISEIPAYSGCSAYDNDKCPSCGRQEVAVDLVVCPSCGGVMYNRPYVERDGQPSLIKGFKSSYRRMSPGRPAYTITTNSSHIGSDFKIHPWENRVLSVLECADLQTVPRFYDWTRATEERTVYLVRNLIGEAFPPYFTYLHGQVLDELLSDTAS